MREAVYTLIIGIIAILFLHYIFGAADEAAMLECQVHNTIETCKWIFN